MKIDNKQVPKRAIGRQGRSLIPFAIAILVVLGLVFGGWGTVYAAQDSGPDDFLYPVKAAVDYLADLTATVTTQDAAPGPKNATSIQIKKLDRDMINDPEIGLQSRVQNRYGAIWDDVATEPLLDDLDLPIDDTLTPTPTITATRTMSGSLWGPGPCLGDTENCPFEYKLGYTHTFTNNVDSPPFQGETPVIKPAPSLGPGENPVKDVQAPEGNTGTTGGTGTKQKNK